MRERNRFVFAGLCLACGLLFFAGCGKKEAPSTVPAPATPVQSSAPTDTPNTPSTPSASTPVSGGIGDAQAALAAKDYERAAALLINLEKSNQSLPPEQAGAAAFQMRKLQQSLMTAAASGDPKAVAAVQQMAQSRHR